MDSAAFFVAGTPSCASSLHSTCPRPKSARSKKKKKKFLDEHWGDAETPDSEPANRQDRAASEDSEESEGVPAIGSGDLDDEDLEKVAESLQKLEQKLSYKNVAETDDMELYEEEEKKPAFMDEEKTYSSFV